MSVTITEPIEIPSGVVSTGLLIVSPAFVEVLSGGTLEDSYVVSSGEVWVDEGGLIQNTSATDAGDVWVEGSAVNLTAETEGYVNITGSGAELNTGAIRDGGHGVVYQEAVAKGVHVSRGGNLFLNGGSALDTIVSNGGEFVAQLSDGKAANTTVLEGGLMRLVSSGAAQDTVVNGGTFFVEVGAATGTLISAGIMAVSSGNTVQNTTLNDGSFVVSSGAVADTVIVGGGTMRVLSGTVQNATLNGGVMEVLSGSAQNTVVNAGAVLSAENATVELTKMNGGTLQATTASVAGLTMDDGDFQAVATAVSDLTVKGGTVVLDTDSVLSGKAAFTGEETSITVDGTIAFDTQYMTSTDAQISGAFTVSDGTRYTLTAEEPTPGVYLLADNIQSFNGEVLYGDVALALNTPVKIGDYLYSLDLAGETATVLQLTISEPETDGVIYVNSEWAELDPETEVVVNGVTATIGVNAFATGDEAAAVAIAEDGKIRIAGGTVYFTAPLTRDTVVYSGAILKDSDVAAAAKLVVNNGGTIVGKAAFEEGASITVNGTVLFDAAIATAEVPQFTGFSVLTGNMMKCSLAVADDQAYGSYLLASGATGFSRTITVRDSQNKALGMLLVGQTTSIGSSIYALDLDEEGVLSVTITEKVIVPDTTPPTVTDVKADITTPTNKNVVVTAVFADDVELAASLYRIGDAVEWSTYVKGVTVTDNTTVYFKAVDAAGNESEIVSYEVTNIDRIPPVAPTASADITEPTNQYVTVTAKFSEDTALKEYSFGGSEWLVYTKAIDFTDNGVVYFRGTDAAGNVSLVTGYTVSNIDKTIPVVPDTTPPTVSNVKASITVPTNQNIVVTAEFKDDVKLMLSLYKFVGEDTWHDYVDGVTVTDNTTVYFKAVDAAGNESEIVSYEVTNIDRIPPVAPTASADITEPTNQYVTVTAKFSDDSATKEYSFNGTDWVAYVKAIDFTDNGVVYFRGTDVAGNISEITGYTVSNIDKTIPEVPDVIPPTVSNITASITVPTNQDVVVTAEFKDDVKLASSLYRIGDAGEWTAYVDGVVMTENGKVFFKAIDAAGKVSDVYCYEVTNIDRIPPAAPEASTSTVEQTEQPVIVTANFSEDSVMQEYSFDGVEWVVYVGPIKFVNNGVVYFRGTDAAGNVSEITGCTVSNIEVVPDDVPPTVTNVRANITLPTNKAVTVTAMFEDDVKLAAALYKLGETGEWTAYVNGVIMTENGTVFFKAIDAAGNESEIVDYKVTNIDPSLPDGQLKVYVNTDWAGLASGTVVASGATIGVDAFATGNEANAAVDAAGVIYLEHGTISFSDAARNVIVSSGADLLLDSEAGADNVTVYLGGSVSMTNGVMSNCTIDGGGILTAASGAMIDGLTYSGYYDEEGNAVNVQVDGAVVKNVIMSGFLSEQKRFRCSMSVAGEGGLVQNAEVIDGGYLAVSSGGSAENIVLTGDTSNYLEGELYVLEDGAASKITVSSGGYLACRNGGSVNDFVIMEGGQAYLRGTACKALVNGGILGIERGCVITGTTVAAGGMMWTVNSAGLGSAFDTEIHSGAFFQNNGYASNTMILSGGTMTMDQDSIAEKTEVWSGGSFLVSYYTEDNGPVVRDVDVKNGGVMQVASACTLTGVITFREGADVTLAAGSILDFDISGLTGTEETPFPLVNDFSFIGAETDLTLTVSGEEQPAGTYLLAGGVTEFDRGIAFGEYTLTVGGEPVRLGENTLKLTLADGLLVLSILAPLPHTYVNDEWSGLPDGTSVTIDVGEGLSIKAVIGTDAFATGDAAVSKTATGGVVQVVGGTASFANTVDKNLVLDQGATLAGKAVFADDVTVTNNGTVAFDTAYATATEAQFSGFDADEEGSGAFTLTVQDGDAAVKNTYLLATGAGSLKGSLVAYGDFTYTVGGIDFYVDGNVKDKKLSYVLDLTEENDLVLSFVKLVNGPDDHKNDWLYNKSIGGVNPNRNTFTDTILVDGVTDIAVDRKGTVKNESGGTAYYNFISMRDDTDFAKITLKNAASLSFAVEATDAAKFTVWSLETGEDKKGNVTYKVKSLQATTLKKDNATGLYSAITKNLLLDLSKEYYISVQSTNKNSTGTYYNVTLNQDVEETYCTVFYTDGDDGTNNWLYDKKNEETPLNPAVYGSDPFVINAETVNVQVDKADTVHYEDEYGTEWNNFAGFGDDTDFVKISLDDPSRLSFNVTATGAAKFIIYSLETGVDKKGNPTYKMKALQTTTLKKTKVEIDEAETRELFMATTKDLLLDLPADNQSYYIAVQSTSAKKGDMAYYNAVINADPEEKYHTVFYSDADDGTNNWLYDKKNEETPVNPAVWDAEPIEIVGVEDICLDAEGSVSYTDEQRGVTYSNYVGFGDSADYARITFDKGASMTFHVEATNASKFTVYSLTIGKDKKGNTTYTMKALQTLTLKKIKAGDLVYYAGDTKELTPVVEGDVRFFLAMESTNAKKGDAVYYNVTAAGPQPVQSAQDASALSMPDAASAFADAAAFDAVNSEQSWNLVSLA